MGANKKQAPRSAPVSGVVDFGLVGFSERSELIPPFAGYKKQAPPSAPVSGVVDFGIVGFSERSELIPQFAGYNNRRHGVRRFQGL